MIRAAQDANGIQASILSNPPGKPALFLVTHVIFFDL
jgi:hypothetical protein